MPELSPAAQAGELILAYRKGGDEVPHPLGLAAALEALADHVTPVLGRSPEDSREDERLCVRDEILDIVAELRDRDRILSIAAGQGGRCLS